MQVRTSYDGTAVVTVPVGEKSFVAAGEWVADCRGGNKPGKNFINANVYAVAQVLSTGAVAQNSCGKATCQPVPGKFVLFVRPMHWWEKMRE
jgi:hypothetical protein